MPVHAEQEEYASKLLDLTDQIFEFNLVRKKAAKLGNLKECFMDWNCRLNLVSSTHAPVAQVDRATVS
jgi:hypothetical protein